MKFLLFMGLKLRIKVILLKIFFLFFLILMFFCFNLLSFDVIFCVLKDRFLELMLEIVDWIKLDEGVNFEVWFFCMLFGECCLVDGLI